MSTSALVARRDGANHLLRHHRRRSSRTRARVDPEGQHALRADRRLDRLVVHQRRGAAELAVLADARRLEHHHRAAAGALDAAAFGVPAALVFRQLAQRRGEVQLLHQAGARGRPGTATRCRRTGHDSFCCVGFHSACAPQAGQACFSSAVISPAAIGSGGGMGGGVTPANVRTPGRRRGRCA